MRMLAGRVPMLGMRRDSHVCVARWAETDGDRRHRAHRHQCHEEKNRQRFQRPTHRMHYDTGSPARFRLNDDAREPQRARGRGR